MRGRPRNEVKRAPRPLYMTDEEFDFCVKVAGSESFSAWGYALLLKEAHRIKNTPGMNPGGLCMHCNGVNAWWFHMTLTQYVCDNCASSYENRYKYLLEDRKPKENSNSMQTALASGLQVIQALVEHGEKEKLFEIMSSAVNGFKTMESIK